MKATQEEPQKPKNSSNNNVIFFSSNQTTIRNENRSLNQIAPQNTNLNKTNQFPSKDIRLNKLNINSSLNNPSPNTATNVSLNEQALHPKKDHSDYFDNEILFQGGEENEPLFKEYTMINDRKNKAMDDFKNINERIKNNNKKIEEIKKSLLDLKEEKKQKEADIINLLSNKESIEEIYKNQIYSLNANPNRQRIFINNANNNNTKVNISNKNNNNEKSLTSPNNTNLENKLNNDEETFKITLNEIKESDQKKYTEQVNNMFEDIFKKKDKKLNSLITKIIKTSYQTFFTNINKENTNENNNEENNESIITNFFKKLSLFISNHSLGRFSECKINLFLRYLLKINSINVKLTQYIKFVNKKYKERKKELNDMLSFLEKKNINLNEKNNRLENNMKDFDDKLDFFEKNDVFELEQKSSNSDEGIYDIDKKAKLRSKGKLFKKNKKKDDEQLSHDVVIEYEDGIDQNVEINYEDDLANDYDYEKEKEMINQGLNPYKSESNVRLNSKKNSVLNKQNIKNNSQVIKDNDESDKYLNDLLTNKEDKNNLYNQTGTTTTSVIVDNRTNLQPKRTLDEKELEKLSAIELEHYKRVQRIMNSGPKVNNIFGVNNYNPENSVNYDNSLFSPKKNIANVSTSSNKIDKTIRIGSSQNHNFVSVINKTKYVPVKKKDKTNKTKDKSKKNKQNDENDGIIQVINLEENFLSEIKNEEKNEIENDTDNKTGNESTSNHTTNNNKNNFNDIIENEDIIKRSINEVSKNDNNMIKNNTITKSINSKSINNNIIINNINNNINNNNINNIINSGNNNNIIINSTNIPSKNKELQGYYLNIMNPSQNKVIQKEKKEDNNKLIEIEKKDSLKNENIENNEFFSNNNNKRTLKITKSRELNINDLKNNKIGILNKKLVNKIHNSKKGGKPTKTKLVLTKNADNKEGFPLNNSLTRPKANNSLNKNITQKKISNNSIAGNIVGNMNYNTINTNNDPTGKRSHSIAENVLGKPEEGKNSNNTTRVVVSNSISTNISQNNIKNRKLSIPISKVKNPNYNSNTYEGNMKKETNNRKK